MMKENGVEFDKMELGSFDMPFGYSTGGAVIFGSSGGVSEAVLRFAGEILEKGSAKEFKQLRGENGIKTSEINVGGQKLQLAVVSGLANARSLIDKIRKGEVSYDLIEVMACSGGCVNGGGQPITQDRLAVIKRSKGLFDNDAQLQFHVSSENPYLQQIYTEKLGHKKAHELLHTTYENRKRISREDFMLGEATGNKEVTLEICFGTSCFLRGAQGLYKDLMNYIRENNLNDKVEFKATFCGKHCKMGPVLNVNGKLLEHCTFDNAKAEIQTALKK